jgi:hypothetical protein
MGAAIYDDGALLAQDSDDTPVLRLDLDTLAFEPLLTPPAPAIALLATTDHIFVETEAAMLRARKDDLELEEVDDSSGTGAIAGDDEATFWIAGAKGGQMLLSLPVRASGAEVIPLGGDLSGIEYFAVTSNALYFVAGPVSDGDIRHCGTVWRLDRPS